MIDSAVAFAASTDNEYTNNCMVSIAYELIFQAGVYADDCKLWRKKSESGQTLPDFKKFFTVANQELRQSKTTTESAGYHTLPHDAVDITHTEHHHYINGVRSVDHHPDDTT